MNNLILNLPLTPGLIWATIVDALCVVGEKRSTLRLTRRGFGFGLASYLVYFSLYYPYFRCRWGVWPRVLDGLATPTSAHDLSWLRPKDILLASLLAGVLALLWSAAANRNLFNLWMRRLRVTRKYGDESLWEFWFSRLERESEFVNVRDLEQGLTYSGLVKAYSEKAL